MSYVKLEKQGHVGVVTIDRQEALNALNSQVLSDLDAAAPLWRALTSVR